MAGNRKTKKDTGECGKSMIVNSSMPFLKKTFRNQRVSVALKKCVKETEKDKLK